jgi:DNA-binding MarR family transcriptional regulator
MIENVRVNRPDLVARYQALLDLLRTSESLWNASRIFFSRWDLSPSQFNVLNLLGDRSEGLSQIEISRLLIMHRSNATGLIDRLEKRGLLRRHAAPGDRRVHRVALTTSGRALLGKILPDYYRLADEAWQGMPIKETRRLPAQLARLNENIARIEGQLSLNGNGESHE